MSKFSERLREIREDRGLRQDDIASLFGYNKSTISQWESGKNEPSLDIVKQLAIFFNVPTDYLLGNDVKYEFEAGKVDSVFVEPVGTYGPKIDQMLKDLGEKTNELVRQGVITEEAAAETIRDMTKIFMKLYKQP
ncbi:MAG: helix-turn-helix transcriptional regulator [Syntrophomonas sp.]